MIVCGIAGWSGAGKTTLLEKLIAALRARGVRVASIKHTHHEVDVDRPGKDSWRHRAAGAERTLLVGKNQWALMGEVRANAAPGLEMQLHMLGGADVVLIEGFKRSALPKIEVFRAELGKPPLWPQDETIRALAADAAPPDCPLPVFALEDVAALADFLLQLPHYEKHAHA